MMHGENLKSIDAFLAVYCWKKWWMLLSKMSEYLLKVLAVAIKRFVILNNELWKVFCTNCWYDE